MLNDTKWTRRIVGATAAVNLALGLAVVGGVIPPQGKPSVMAVASAAPLDAAERAVEDAPEEGPTEAVGDDAAAPGDAPPEPQSEDPGVSAAAPPPAAPEPSPADAPPPPPPPPSSATAVSAPAPGSAAPATPPAGTPVPRRQPSPAEVQQAINGLAPYVDTPFTPTAANINQAGDMVCTAFDEGQTFTQVKATARELVAKLPMTTVHAGADDYVVRTAVALYCPGHAPKLV